MGDFLARGDVVGLNQDAVYGGGNFGRGGHEMGMGYRAKS